MTPPERRAGALAQRLAALLCLTGAGLFGLAAAAVSRLDHVSGLPRYRLPGGAALDAAALTVLIVCAGLFALCGLALLLLSPIPLQAPPLGRFRRRPVLVLILGLAALLAVAVARHPGF